MKPTQLQIERDALEWANTHQLAVGDVVLCHGDAFRLTERHVSQSEFTERQGECIWFKTEYLGRAVGSPAVIPGHWVNDWTVQGNKLASFSRVLRFEVV